MPIDLCKCYTLVPRPRSLGISEPCGKEGCNIVVKKELSRKVKLLIYQSVYIPSLSHGHDLWLLTTRTRSQIQASEIRLI